MLAEPADKRLRVVVVGCTPLARKVAVLANELCSLVGVANLTPRAGAGKSNYDCLVGVGVLPETDIHWTDDINSEASVAWLRSRDHDVVLQCGWSQVFGRTLLSLPRLFAIGIHPSPLPVGRGAAVINWKIIEGGGRWGNSIFVMESGTDAGDILDFEPFDIEARDDVVTVFYKVERTALKMLRRTLPKLVQGTLTRRRQDTAVVTRYYRRTPDDGLLDLQWSASRALDHIRALTRPFPGAFVDSRYGRLIVWRGIEGESSTEVPGTVLLVESGRGVRIAMGNGTSLWLTLVTPPNDTECWMDDWAREIELTPGACL